jgi:zinc protease
MAVSFPVPNVGSADWSVVRVIDELLGGESGILSRDQRLRQLAPTPRTILMPRSGDSTLTVLAGSPVPWRVEMLREELSSVVDDLGAKSLPAVEVDAAKKCLLGQTACELRDPARRAIELGWAVQSGRDAAEMARDPLAPLRAVSPDDVKRVAAEWLVSAKAGLGLVLPVVRRGPNDRMDAARGG